MNMIKKTDGFTLVELIVVIAILAILAAIAVPAYSGYIAKANEAADYTQLDAIKTAATFAMTEKVNEATMTKLVVEEGETDVTVYYTVPGDATVKNIVVSVSDYATAITFKSDNVKATWCLADDPATTVDEEGWTLAK